MPVMKTFWNELGGTARGGLLCGFALILALMIAAAAWLLRADYQVLFADLKPQDAAAMTAELERMKVPFKIASDGNTILVDATAVHTTRLKLMGKDIPLHGTAGFELFNNADFGMTEFAQKINYQRALQGEITRTILSLSEVRDARVHLALPEEGLFKRATSKAKAAITLSLRAGQSLRGDQISGIQRLVSAAVPGILSQDVTIVDQQGVALTKAVSAEGEQEAAASALDLKRDTERLLARKATEVLERAVGAGQALATVDVSLNMDQVRVTTEDVLGSPASAGHATSGVMVRERETMRDVGAPLNSRGDVAGRVGNSQREIDYQVGRRIEQVVTQPGAIRRLHAVAMISQVLDDAQLEQMRLLLAGAVGAVLERGDSVIVQSLRGLEPASPQDLVEPVRSRAGASPAKPVAPPHLPLSIQEAIAGMGVAVVAVAALSGWVLWRRRRTDAPRLTVAQRQAVLDQMREWLEAAPAPSQTAVGPAPTSKGVRP
jgi:flagellar M-ring protein FliF